MVWKHVASHNLHIYNLKITAAQRFTSIHFTHITVWRPMQPHDFQMYRSQNKWRPYLQIWLFVCQCHRWIDTCNGVRTVGAQQCTNINVEKHCRAKTYNYTICTCNGVTVNGAPRFPNKLYLLHIQRIDNKWCPTISKYNGLKRNGAKICKYNCFNVNDAIAFTHAMVWAPLAPHNLQI